MRIIIALSLLILINTLYAAPVSYINVVNEASYKKISDFNNTFEINVNEHGKEKIHKCQAVRLDRNWFITAAHCVKPFCDKACSLQVRLIVAPKYEMDLTVIHTAKKPLVFTSPQANVSEKNAAYDIALIYFKPAQSKIIYKDTMGIISEAAFIDKLPSYNMYSNAYYGGDIAPILSIDAKADSIVNRSLAVVSIWDGKRYLLSSTRPVFYSPTMHYIHTENFGIVQGLSGSGVMANTGELIGIVSAIANLDYNDEKTKEPIKTSVIFIASFDKVVLDFIKQYVPTVSYKTDTGILGPVPPSYLTFNQNLEKASEKAKNEAVQKEAATKALQSPAVK